MTKHARLRNAMPKRRLVVVAGFCCGLGIACGRTPLDPSDRVSPHACGNTQSNPFHCGVCGHYCCGGDCVGGICQPGVLVVQSNSILGMAADDANVYFSGYSGTISKIPVTGGTPVMLASTDSWPTRVAIDAESVYWSAAGNTGGANGPVSGGIFKVPMAGGPVVTLASAPDAIHWAVAVGGMHVYWTAYQEGTVNRANLDGSDVMELASGQPGPVEIAVDDTHVYWTTLRTTVLDGRVTRALLDGSAQAVFLSGQCGWGLALDRTNLYCSGETGLVKAPLAGGSPTILGSINSPQKGWSVAVDSAHAYWGLDEYGSLPILLKLPLDGGPQVTLAPTHKFDSVTTIATNARCVYWAQVGSDGSSSLFALAR